MKMIPHSRPTLGPLEAAAAARVLRSGQVAQGAEVEKFEREAARFLGCRHAAAVSSGTAALALTLKALGAGPDKEVLLPAYACAALIQAVRWIGAEPVPADVHWHDGNLSFGQVFRKLTHRTAAIVLVHSFGTPAEIEPFLRTGVPVVEDLAQAFGAQDYDRRKIGTYGAAAVASFYATKLLTSGGEGGMVISNDRRLVDAVRDVREYDEKKASLPRWNVKMTDLQAAVGRVQLKRLPSFLEARRSWARRYREELKGLPVEFPLPLYGTTYHRFILRARRPVPESFFVRARAKGIMIRRPVERPPYWDDVALGRFPVSDRLWRRSVSLPIFPSLTENEFRRVVAFAQEAFSL